jgi:uncharacterized membrane protein
VIPSLAGALVASEDPAWEQVAERSAELLEVIGVAVLLVGGAVAFGRWLRTVLGPHPSSITRLRNDLGRVILLALEVLVAADLVLTVVVDRTIEAVAVLGILVLIRVVLSWSLEVDIDGTWPWRRAALRDEAAPGER